MKQTDLVGFMYKELGGEDVVFKKFLMGKLGSLSNKSISQIYEIGKEEGWLEQFQGMKLVDLLEATKKAGVAKAKGKRGRPAKGTKAPRKRFRMTDEQVEALKLSILGFLKDNPWSKKKDIAAGVKADPLKVFNIMKGMKEEGSIKSDGEKARMVYAVKGERKGAGKEE